MGWNEIWLLYNHPLQFHAPFKLFLVVKSLSVSEPQGSVLSLSDLSLKLNLLEALIVPYGFHYHKHTDDIRVHGTR